MATTCPKCNATDLSSEKYYMDDQTGAKTILVSGKKDSSIIAIAGNCWRRGTYMEWWKYPP